MPGETTRREQRPDSSREGNAERDPKNANQQQHEQGKHEQGNRPGQSPQQGDRQNPNPSDPNRKGTEKSGSGRDEDTSTQRSDDRSKQPQR